MRMNLGTKNRLNQIATVCKAHLHEANPTKVALVNEFITEIEGTDGTGEGDITRWSQFTDVKRSQAEMLQRVDEAFARWLNP